MSSTGEEVTEGNERELAEEWKAMGNEEYKAENYEKAVQCYTNAIELLPNEAAYYGNRAAARMMLHEWKKALEDALFAISKDPSFTKGHLRAGKCYLHLGDFTRSKLQYEKALEFEPNNGDAKRDLQLASRLQDQITEGKQLLEQKKYMEALHVFADVMSTVDSSLLVMILKAYCFLGLKQHDQASKLASTVLRQDPENTEAMYIRGKALYYGGNFEHAVSHYSQALRLDPDFSKARDELRKVRLLERKKKDGNDAFTRGDYEEAVNAYTEALAIDPDNVQFNSQLFANRAAARGKLRLFEEAISDCTRAIDLDNGYVKAYMRRANLYSQVERYEDAVRDYEAAKKLDPENRDIREGLRQAKVDLKRSKRKDYYKILCLPKDATEAQIKKAYRKLALQWHPDKHSHSVEAARKAEEMFKDVTEAYSVLSDPKKRQRYDMGADLEDLDGPGGFGGEGVDVNEIFSMFFGGPGGPGGMHGMPGGFQSSFRPRQHHHYHGGRGGYGGGGYDSFFG